MHEIRNREFRLYICFFAASFSCFSFSFPSPQQIRNREFRLFICFFVASLYCFSFSFAMRPSFTVVIRQCSDNTAARPSTAFDDNDLETEEQRSRWNLWKVNRKEWKILRSTTFSYAVRKLTHLGGGHHKLVYRHSEMAYIHHRQREAAWHTVT